ncbi:hypothetical protein GCM10022226_03530 [Sphaerisporangium flaviroseum]|uniref:Uncharacterized protein n=1 Tax=Sphaerisporangium flaviroseum TaxID=509199 RepID=A0ABP7HAH8_9ACTN
MDRYPADAAALSAKYVTLGCEDDDDIAVVGRRYRFTGNPHAVVDYYKDAAGKQGWHLFRDGSKERLTHPQSSDVWPGETCFSKDLGKFTGYLSLAGDYTSPELGSDPPTKTYWLEISFAASGGGWCTPD